MMFHPGPSEIEWLADLKATAEQVGAEVLGEPIRWRVETLIAAHPNRSDVRIERDNGELLFTGEAKRPDDPRGAHPLVASEVADAVTKAQEQGGRFCFTTNFHQTALFEAGPGLSIEPFRRIQGGVMDLIPESVATCDGWWLTLTDGQRESLARDGLKALFERYGLASAGHAPAAPVDDIAVGFFGALTQALLAPLHRAFLAQPKISSELQHRALASKLDPQDGQDCRYLVAQGIAEALSAALFHRVLRDHFSGLGSLLGGTSPSRGQQLWKTVDASLDDATRMSGDYEPILQLSEIARWVLAKAPNEVVPHWLSLLSFVDRLDVSAISGDVLGSIFERLNSPERRRAMGQHYTQPRLARAMAEWGMTSEDLTVLDPACGAGTFLVETYIKHRDFGLAHDEILERTLGNDLDPFAVHLASINLATRRIRKGLNHPVVRLGDAFDLSPATVMLHIHPTGGPAVAKKFIPPDLVITNPPYGRAVDDEASCQAKVDSLMMKKSLPSMAGANIAAWFVLLGKALGHDSTRMAFVLPSSVLQNDNLRAWRRWLRGLYDMVIWHTEQDVWFSDARVAPCVILFEPRNVSPGDDATGQVGGLTFVNVTEPTNGELHDLSGIPAPAEAGEVRDLSWVEPDDDILIHGTKPQSLLRFEQYSTTLPIAELDCAEQQAGQKLGHAFYRLKDRDPDSPGVMREVEGLGTTFRVSRAHLTPILHSPKSLTNGEPVLHDTWLLTLPAEMPRNEALRAYIALAKANRVHEAPSVIARGRYWWSMTPSKAEIAVPLGGQFQHQVAWLDPSSVANNNFNILRVKDSRNAEVIGASLSSAFGALSRLYVSGEVGCEGMRRVLLSQFERWNVLDAEKVDVELAERCISEYRAYRQLPTCEMDEIPPDELNAWRRLSAAVARAALGPSGTEAEATELADSAIRECQTTVARRRLRESMALGGRTRQVRSGGRIQSRVRRWCDQSGLYERSLRLLVSGPQVVTLRPADEVASLSLFGESGPFGSDHVREQRLGELLEPGFEAAPPSSSEQSGELDELLTALQQMTDEIVISLISDAPPVGYPARATWEELREQVLTTLHRKLQADIRAELS